LATLIDNVSPDTGSRIAENARRVNVSELWRTARGAQDCFFVAAEQLRRRGRRRSGALRGRAFKMAS
jgi:hypothetical protein